MVPFRVKIQTTREYSMKSDSIFAFITTRLTPNGPMWTGLSGLSILVGHTRCLPERVRQFGAGASPGKDGAIDRGRDGRGRMTVLAFCMTPPWGAPACQKPNG